MKRAAQILGILFLLQGLLLWKAPLSLLNVFSSWGTANDFLSIALIIIAKISVPFGWIGLVVAGIFALRVDHRSKYFLLLALPFWTVGALISFLPFVPVISVPYLAAILNILSVMALFVLFRDPARLTTSRTGL